VARILIGHTVTSFAGLWPKTILVGNVVVDLFGGAQLGVRCDLNVDQCLVRLVVMAPSIQAR